MISESKKALTTTTSLSPFEWEPPNVVTENVGSDDGELRRMRSFDYSTASRRTDI
jgi:hypothetical protein